jgi:hypothetical protein
MVVYFVIMRRTLECIFIDAIIVAELLQLASSAAPDAGQAFPLMVRHDELERMFSGCPDLRRVGKYLHAFGNRENTRGLKDGSTLHFDKAEPARACFAEAFQIA